MAWVIHSLTHIEVIQHESPQRRFCILDFWKPGKVSTFRADLLGMQEVDATWYKDSSASKSGDSGDICAVLSAQEPKLCVSRC